MEHNQLPIESAEDCIYLQYIMISIHLIMVKFLLESLNYTKISRIEDGISIPKTKAQVLAEKY